MKQVVDVCDLLDSPDIQEKEIRTFFLSRGLENGEITTQTVEEKKGKTLFLRMTVGGTEGKLLRGGSPTIGVIGQLGGVGARPKITGLVSDADGAITALASACKIIEMRKKGDRLPGDVIVTTHICPDAPTIPHEPVPFMDSPVSLHTMNQYLVDEQMDAILSIDTTKGNRVINQRGFAISPTVKDGYILRVSEDLMDIMQNVTGRLPLVFPATTQDITPYGNGIYHINSILQPATAATAPVVGLALTTEIAVPGCASGASQVQDIESAARFVVEAAKAFTEKNCSFYSEKEFKRLIELYGSMEHLKKHSNET